MTLSDDYAWLRDRDDPAVRAYLEAENAHTEHVLSPVAALRDRLFEEMVGRIREDDTTAPVPHGGYRYYARRRKGLQYAIHCRRRDSDGAGEDVLIDGNARAEGHPHFQLGALEISPDHRRLAWSEDLDGSERHTLYVSDLSTGTTLTGPIENTAPDVAWANDASTLFYLELDAMRRPCRVRRHRVGIDRPDGRDDPCVYEETDTGLYLGLGATRSRRFVGFEASSHTTSEVWLIDASEPGSEPRCVAPRRKGVEYDVEHGDGRLWIRSNAHGVNFGLYACPDDDVTPERWTRILAPREDVFLEGVAAFRHHQVRWERRDGLRRIVVRRASDGTEHEVEFPEPAYGCWQAANPEYDTRTLRFGYSSPVTPPCVFAYDLDTRERTLLKEEPVLGGYDRTRFVVERRHGRAPDGAQVPISVVRPRGEIPSGGYPMVLSGYGAYGLPRDATFSSARLSLLERGFAVGIAHVRGGGEMGRRWYESGKLAHKTRTFDDCIACAEALIADGTTSPGRLAIRGGSAGGLLVGAVLNRRPELFAAAIANVPFVDVLNTMLDPTLPLTVIEYDEWGNPEEREAFERIRGYSPYDNVEPKAYPAMLVTAGLNDPRVGFWEPAKWVAKLRALRTDHRPMLLKTHLGAGHGGASGRYDALKDVALECAFLLFALGLDAGAEGTVD